VPQFVSENRCDSLAITLASIVDQKLVFAKGDELIIVDNNSSDRTKEVVHSFAEKLPLRYVFEQQQGLSVARNRLISETNVDFIIFIDDDVTLGSELVNEYRDAFSCYPNAGFFGGKIAIDWCREKPSWYRDASLPLINGLLCHYDLGDDDFQYADNDLLPYGANFALPTATIKAIGQFNEALGVNGDKLDRGEETDYFIRAIAAGLNGHYIAKATVGHRFDARRMSMHHLYSYGLAKGRSSVDLSPHMNLSSELNTLNSKAVFFFQQIKYAAKACFQLVKGRRDRFYQSVINLGIRRGVYLRSRGL